MATTVSKPISKLSALLLITRLSRYWPINILCTFLCEAQQNTEFVKMGNFDRTGLPAQFILELNAHLR